MTDLEPFLTHNVRNAALTHMLEDLTVEVCGMITLSSGEYMYERCNNVSPTPATHFAYEDEPNSRIQLDPAVVAFVHSHPVGPGNPSKRDMEIQKLVGKPSVITCMAPLSGVVDIFSFGNHLLDLDLTGREFRYGVTDCYEAIRSWRWQNEGIKMEAFARHNGWWNVGEADGLKSDELDMYSQFYRTQGYVPFDVNINDPMSECHPQVGDLVLMQMGGTLNVINHAAIYVGNNLIYHHRVNRKSGNTPVGYCMQTGAIRGWARQADKFKELVA